MQYGVVALDITKRWSLTSMLQYHPPSNLYSSGKKGQRQLLVLNIVPSVVVLKFAVFSTPNIHTCV